MDTGVWQIVALKLTQMFGSEAGAIQWAKLKTDIVSRASELDKEEGRPEGQQVGMIH